tara:strand:- start:63 stop:725 length:663 start_codon:yes stop_codon:yes gene_type:complete
LLLNNKEMKKSKFDISSQIPLSFRIKEFFRSLLFWKGRKKGMIHTRNIVLNDFRYIFFPKNFADKYGYLGTSVWNEDGVYFKSLYPLVLALDYEAKPKWCPRWVLRFLDVFGSDRSIVRVRNRRLHNLQQKLTKGIAFIDWKTKWSDYDLRISIHAPEHLQELASAIENRFYSRGRQKEIVEQIKAIDPYAGIIWGSVSRLENQLEELEETFKTKKENLK